MRDPMRDHPTPEVARLLDLAEGFAAAGRPDVAGAAIVLAVAATEDAAAFAPLGRDILKHARRRHAALKAIRESN